MRALRFEQGGIYHVGNNRGGEGHLFQSEADRVRFLFLLLYLQGERTMHHAAAHAERFLKTGRFRVRMSTEKDVLEKRRVELLAFTLLPASFELLLKTKTGTGISTYLHAVSVAYTKYFNGKYRREGHLFRGPFQAAGVGSGKELLSLTAYLHRRTRELPEWRSHAADYPFSSYSDYAQKNRFGALLSMAPALVALPSGVPYRKFVERVSAKELVATLPAAHFFT